MEAKTNEQDDWRNDITEPKSTLKLADKEVVAIAFMDEGTKKISVDFGSSVVFAVKKIATGEELQWYVNSRNFDLLGQIKALDKPLKGKTVEIKREGLKKSDTRYTIAKIVVE